MNQEGITRLLNTLVAPQFEVIKNITLDWHEFGEDEFGKDEGGWYSKINVNLNHPVSLDWTDQVEMKKAVLDALKYLGIRGTEGDHILFV